MSRCSLFHTIWVVLLIVHSILNSVCQCLEITKPANYYTTKTLEGMTSNFENVPSKYAYMLSPTGLCVGLNGELYVSDAERHLIYKIRDENWSTVEIYAGYSTNGYNGDGQHAVGTLFDMPTSVAVNPLNGDLFIADSGNDLIRIVSSSTRLVSSISSDKKFNKPRGVCVSSNGNAYIADTDNHLIWKYEISTQTLTIYGGGGQLNGEFDNIEAKQAKLSFPKNIHVVSSGKNDLIYFTDDERVKHFDENGIYRVIDGGNPQPNLYGIYVTNDGNIYTSSQMKHFIEMKQQRSAQFQLFIGSSLFESGYDGDNSMYDSGNVKFYGPSSLVVTQNSIVIADKSNSCIRKINLQTKQVTTLAGGFINHPNDENISPIKMYSQHATTLPFTYKNDFYFVELGILRKVSNGKMTTILGCERNITYTANIPQRTYLPIDNLHNFGNGDLLISQKTIGIWNFNLETMKLTQVTNLQFQYFVAIGNSYENSTIYIRTDNARISVFKKATNSIEYLYIDSNTFIQSLGILENSTDGSNSIFHYSIYDNSIYEYNVAKNGDLTSKKRKLPTRFKFSSFSVSEGYFYFWSNPQVFELEWNSFSFRKLVGFDVVNVSNTDMFISGFNGDDIPVESSAIDAKNVIRQDSIIYITNSYHISQVSNGKITTIAGINPLAKTLTPQTLMRDSSTSTLYFLDATSLKKFDENSGQSSSLSMNLYRNIVIPVDLPYLTLNILSTAPGYGVFSKFDKKLYIFDSCRIIRIDPMTMNFEKIIGSECGNLLSNVKGIESPCPLNSLFKSISIDDETGDLLILDTRNIVFRYVMKTTMLTIEHSFTLTDVTFNNVTDNPTSIFYQNGYLYYSGKSIIRRIEKSSNSNEYFIRNIVGTFVTGYSGSGKNALSSPINNPSAFHVKKNGDIIILDGKNSKQDSQIIRMYEKQSELLLDLSGKIVGNAKYNGDGNGFNTVFVSFSNQVEFNEKSGEIYFIDGNSFIRKIIPQCDENYVFNTWNNTCVMLLNCNGTLASNSNVCNGNGICSDFDVCQCNENFEGQYCQINKRERPVLNSSAVLIVAIVVPIIGSLLLISFFVIITIIVICVIFKSKKKNRFEIAQANVDQSNLELSDNPFPSSMIISSSAGSVESEKENAFSRYSNMVRIGQGAFGSVFKCIDTKCQNKIKAIKVVRFENFTDLNTIMKEASQLSTIKHPNIIKVNDYFITSDNLLVIDMDYYEIGDLIKLKQENLKEKIVKQILKQSLNALQYIHEEMRIIHRDIKPSNIFIKKITSYNIEIIIADFGLAKKYQENAGQSYAGTPLYMSPEVALGSSYSFNTDIFSMGVSIYQIMTNDFTTSIGNLIMGNQSENSKRILTKQMKESVNDEYSDELIEIVLSMLKKDSNQRPNASHLLSLQFFN